MTGSIIDARAKSQEQRQAEARTLSLDRNRATYEPPNLRFMAAFKTTPAPVHNNLGDFLTNSPVKFHDHAALNAQMAADAKAYRGYAEKSADAIRDPNAPQKPKSPRVDVLERFLGANDPKISPAPSAQARTAPEATATAGANAFREPDAKDAPTPVRSFAAAASPSRLAREAPPVFGLATSAIEQDDSPEELAYTGERGLEREGKKAPPIKVAGAGARTAPRVEEIELTRKIASELQRQLRESHPRVSVPIRHPEGMVDINLRFSSNGTVRALFAGSNPEIVQLLAQHRDLFVKTIKGEGYRIDERHMGFIHQPFNHRNLRI